MKPTEHIQVGDLCTLLGRPACVLQVCPEDQCALIAYQDAQDEEWWVPMSALVRDPLLATV